MRYWTILTLLATGVLALGLAACGSGGDDHDHGSHAEGGTQDHADHADDGDDGGHDDDGGLAAVVELTKTDPSGDYPLTTCVVSGEELGSMGEPLVFEYEGQEVQFCCAGCVDDFKKSPANFLAKVNAARDR